MKNFKIEIIQNKKTDTLVKKVIRIKATNDKMMTINEVKKFYKYLLDEKQIDTSNISILGKSTDKHRTLKTFDDTDLKLWNDENYYEDKPDKKQLSKVLNEFFYVDFIFNK